MKVKLLMVLGTVTAIFVIAVLWKVDGFVYGDRLSWAEAQTRTQISGISRAIEMEMTSLQRFLFTAQPENLTAKNINWQNLGSSYYALATFSVQGKTLVPKTLVIKEDSPAGKWTLDFAKQAVGDLNEVGKGVYFYIKPFQDSERGRHVALVIIEGARAIAVFSGGEIFRDLIDAQKGTLGSFSVVTAEGLTVGHSVSEYLGTVMKDDVLYQESQKSEASRGYGVFSQSNKAKVFGMYERLPRSNLYILSSTPMRDLLRGRGDLIWQFVFMAAGLMLVGSATLIWLVRPEEQRMEELEADVVKLKNDIERKATVQKAQAMNPELIQQEKMESYMRVASALGHEMRAPLMAILGHAQIILARTEDAEVQKSIESIVRETRASRETLDKLFSFAGEAVAEKNKMKVEGPLARALKNLETLLKNKGVKVIRNFDETKAIDLNMEALTKAFEGLLTNAVESMDRMPKKELHLDLFEDYEGIHLKINDTGEGIEEENLDKVFDPFFTTRSFKNHMGLGLAVALGVIRDHHGEIKLVSERGQGTEVNILFRREEITLSQSPVMESHVDETEEVDNFVMAQNVPQLSPEARAAEPTAEQGAVPASTEVTAASSPLDMNIENMLELPEVQDEGEARSTEAPSAEVVLSTEAASTSESSQPAAPPKAAPKTATDDGPLRFLDEPPAKNTSKEPASVDEAPTETAEEKAPVVGPPKMPPPKSKSDIESYRVEIPRPGKRI